MVSQGPGTHDYYPYKPGSVIKAEFFLEDPGISDQNDQHSNSQLVCQSGRPEILYLTVIKTLSRTLSCVLLVDLIPLETMSESSRRLASMSPHILKLCDRRFSDGHRKEYGAAVWTLAIEAEFCAFKTIPEPSRPHVSVEIGDDSWEYNPYAEESDMYQSGSDGRTRKTRIVPENWSVGHREAYLQKHCDKLYSQEVEVYRALRDIQGDLVPKLYGTVTVPRKNKKGKRRVQSKGMLIQYMRHSFTLRDLPERIPQQERWQDLGREAIRVVQDIGDMGVINSDARLDNILVVPVMNATGPSEGFADTEENQSYKLVMIDFGLARVQAEDESDDAFRRARMEKDEEGAVGFVLSNHLLKHAKQLKSFNGDHPFHYKPSGRLNRSWDNDDADI